MQHIQPWKISSEEASQIWQRRSELTSESQWAARSLPCLLFQVACEFVWLLLGSIWLSLVGVPLIVRSVINGNRSTKETRLSCCFVASSLSAKYGRGQDPPSDGKRSAKAGCSTATVEATSSGFQIQHCRSGYLPERFCFTDASTGSRIKSWQRE